MAMQDAYNNHFLGGNAVENHMRALHYAPVGPAHVRATPPCFRESSQLPKPLMQVVDVADYLDLAPAIK
jgi:hypothetical protein